MVLETVSKMGKPIRRISLFHDSLTKQNCEYTYGMTKSQITEQLISSGGQWIRTKTKYTLVNMYEKARMEL